MTSRNSKIKCFKSSRKIAVCGLLTVFLSLLASQSFAAIKFGKTPVGRPENFVAALYQDLLSRPPSSSEVNALIGLLRQGKTRDLIISSTITGAEQRGIVIQSLFKRFLNKSADATSLSNYLTILANGGSYDDLRLAILSSDDYFSAHTDGSANSNAQFVDSVFNDVLGRTATQNEGAELLRQLFNNQPRSATISPVVFSAEAHTPLINAYYSKFLQRSPSSLELTSMLQILGASGDENFLIGLLRTPEYFADVSPAILLGATSHFYLGSIVASKGIDISKAKVTINWGDKHRSAGTLVSTGSDYAVFGTHRYLNGGTFPISITVTIAKTSLVSTVSFTLGGQLSSIVPFAASNKSGVTVATGDVNGDGIDDLIVGSGPGTSAIVAVYDGFTGNLIKSFLAFNSSFKGGVFVAAGDVNDDGKEDIIVGAGSGSSQVKVFSGADFSLFEIS